MPRTKEEKKPNWYSRLQKARAEAEPPLHAWFQWEDEDNFDSCARCGVIRPNDESKLKPCPGVISIALR